MMMIYYDDDDDDDDDRRLLLLLLSQGCFISTELIIFKLHVFFPEMLTV